MGDFTSINTALSGILAQRKALEVIGHNIANAQTDGYTRQTVQMQSTGVSGYGLWSNSGGVSVGTGVTVESVTRMREELLDQQARRAMSGDANASKTADILGGVERLMPEPSDTGIAAKLSQFWNAWDDAAASPGDVPTRQALLENAATLTTTFHQVSSSISAFRSSLQDDLTATVAQVNADSARVAELNQSITAAIAGGANAGDLQDQRDLLVDRIVAATGATTRPGEGGTVDIFLGGGTLVRGAHADALAVVNGPNLDPPLDTMGLTRTELRWQVDGYPVANLGGTAAATLSGINDSVPSYLHQLDEVAGSVVASVNALHLTGHGLDPVADVDLNFFDPTATTAATIAVSTDVAGQPSRIALAAGTGGALDGSLAHQIAALTESPTGPDALHRQLVGRLAIDVDNANGRAAVQANVATQAKSDRQAVIGVSLDEEMTNLVATQHAFEASSRVLTAVDEMLDTLINRTGTVGR
jgi:flagellar hook-associated protein 1 FlgK